VVPTSPLVERILIHDVLPRVHYELGDPKAEVYADPEGAIFRELQDIPDGLLIQPATTTVQVHLEDCYGQFLEVVVQNCAGVRVGDFFEAITQNIEAL
jgi:hypothetical protein